MSNLNSFTKIIILLLVVIFSLFGGMMGGILARNYLINTITNIKIEQINEKQQFLTRVEKLNEIQASLLGINDFIENQE